MSQIITRSNELIRISPTSKAKIEYSITNGKSWLMRYNNIGITGEFIDLTDNGREIIATTSKGLYYSTTEGRSWNKRG